MGSTLEVNCATKLPILAALARWVIAVKRGAILLGYDPLGKYSDSVALGSQSEIKLRE
jgi:hypothetical protein